MGRTANGAFLTDSAEMQHTDIFRFIRNQRQIGGHGGKPYAGAVFFRDEVSQPSELTEPRINRQGHKEIFVMPEMVGSSAIAQVSNESRKLGGDYGPFRVVQKKTNEFKIGHSRDILE